METKEMADARMKIKTQLALIAEESENETIADSMARRPITDPNANPFPDLPLPALKETPLG